MIPQIILLVILIMLNALFACAEIAIISVNPNKLEKIAGEEPEKYESLKKLLDNSHKGLAAIQTAVTLSGFIAAAFAADYFAEPVVQIVMKASMPVSEEIVRPFALICVTAVLAFVTIVFGELVPKRAAMKDPERLAMKLSGAVNIIRVIFAPMVWLLNVSAGAVLRIMGVNPDSSDAPDAEEEILKMSDAGAEKGTIDETENRIIKNIFAFDDMTAEQICTHRTDVSVIWNEDPVEKWEETIHRTRHSRFPICGESVDEIIGILNAKDYFRLENKSRENIMKNAVREPFFVHETMKADNLFAQMKKKGADHFAVVADEYGGMTGIITVTDLVEQLVGDFDDDELDEPELKLKKIGGDTWIVPGTTTIGELCEELEIELEAEKYDTFGGYVIAELGEIPKDGTKTFIERDGLHIDVLKIFHHRVEICKVKIMS